MSDAEKPPPGKRLRTRHLAEQENVCVRTIERWVEAGILPQPDRINGRKFWPEGTRPKTDTAV
jgi:hypothetical protein